RSYRNRFARGYAREAVTIRPRRVAVGVPMAGELGDVALVLDVGDDVFPGELGGAFGVEVKAPAGQEPPAGARAPTGHSVPAVLLELHPRAHGVDLGL